VATSEARRFLGWSVVTGTLTALLVVTQAWLLASVIAGAVARGQSLGELSGRLWVLVGVVVARAMCSWVTELLAGRTASGVKSELRGRLAAQLVELGPAALVDEHPGTLATFATTGLDGLDVYYSRYLPQVVLAAVVPCVVVVAVATKSCLSAVLIAVTVPLIPVFMVLVGHAAAARTERRAAALERLAGHFLDVVEGLPTLRVFRRARFQAAAIRTVTDEYRTTTMSTLRLAFVSSLVLELLATISVALVAVEVGLRLLSGSLSLEVAFFVLIAAPEAYLPLRTLGASYHAIGDGLAAASRCDELLARPTPPRPTVGARPDVAAAPLVVDAVTLWYPGRARPALSDASIRVEPGEHVGLVGPSGAGKSTLLAAILGFVVPSEGYVRVGGVDVTTASPEDWLSQLAWVSQRPRLFASSLEENLRLGAPGASEDELWAVVHDAELDDVVARLPRGLATRLGSDGEGLSVGERQRVAIARALLRDADLLLLDEPTAGVDEATERRLVDAIRRRAAGRSMVLVAHRPSLLQLVDRVVELAPPS
jgi:ATP-binding cassette subfamily C protein CydCD